MTFYGSLATATASISAMGQAFEAISSNIINSSTNGYKTQDVRFSAEFNPQPYTTSFEVGSGASTYQYYNNDQSNPIVQTNRANDFAINGRGFFITRENFNTGKYLLTANGSFDRYSVDNGNVIDGFNDFDTYLVDQHGHYLLGWAYNPDTEEFGAGINNLQTLEPINIRRFVPIVQLPERTENTALDANIPATYQTGKNFDIIHRVYDGTGESEQDDSEVFLRAVFTKTENFNEFTMSLQHASTTERGRFSQRPQDDLIIQFAGDGSGIESVFRRESGNAVSANSVAFTIPNLGGEGSQAVINYDLSKLTNFDSGSDFIGEGQILQRNLSNDGNPYRIIHYQNTEIGEDGVMTIQYTHGIRSTVAKIPYGKVFNPRALITQTGPTLEPTDESGDIQIFEFAKSLTDGDTSTTAAQIYQRNINASNTNLTKEFTNMIVAQEAYNSATTVLRTIDEMIKRATDVKG